MLPLPNPWPDVPVTPENFRNPPREYGILPFWFLNGQLDPEEMRFQLRELYDKGMAGTILHGRYGLEMPYIGEKYLDRVRLAVEEAGRIGLQAWIYDEMNWPSGTADKRVLQARPDLAQRYIECLNFTVRGPWFTYLTGADSRYIDFERSKPVAAFAVSLGGGAHQPGARQTGDVLDLTPNLSFENVIPWEAPPGMWRLMYIVEKEADYYIDALNPEATAEFLRQGYEPFIAALGGQLTGRVVGFYTDEPAMHYYVTGGENPIVPWTKDMFQRFQARNGYNLRPCLPDLFFDIGPTSARVRYDFFNTLTEFYSQAYYRQIYEWCGRNGVLFTGHLLYEEWLRKLIRVEGNLFRHYPYMHVIGVDHLYPYVGGRDRPDEHVAMKVGASAAHQNRSPRLLCESFGGIFMDATMQRMKWIADWEYVLGVNLLNPHGFHYTLEGPRKRDWPPSQFYQYPWWRFYGGFSAYMSRLSHLLSGGRHVAPVAVLWPLNSLIAHFTPQQESPLSHRMLDDFNALTDLLLRAHWDFDYLDEDVFAGAGLEGGTIQVADEAYPLLVIPPVTHIRLETLEKIERFVAQGGRVLGTVFLPDQAFDARGTVDIAARVEALFGIDPRETQQTYPAALEPRLERRQHSGGGRSSSSGRSSRNGQAAFLRTCALSRRLPPRLLQGQPGFPGQPDESGFVVEAEGETSRYFYAPADSPREEITAEVNAERQALLDALQDALRALAAPDVVIDNPEVFYLHRIKDGQDIYFFVNPTRQPQSARVTLQGDQLPVRWDPSTGERYPLAPLEIEGQGEQHLVSFALHLPPVGSAFVLPDEGYTDPIVETNLEMEFADSNGYTADLPGGEDLISGFARVEQPFAVIERDGRRVRLEGPRQKLPEPLVLEGAWEFTAEGDNALIIDRWWARAEQAGENSEQVPEQKPGDGWLEMKPGAWSYQLPAEPGRAYPIPVWYRIPFHAGYLPAKLHVIVDGFAGQTWKLWLNGRPVTAQPVRSAIDSQMQAVDITGLVQQGANVLALRLVVDGPTGGLLDLVKLVGDFSLAGEPGAYHIAPPRHALQPAPWTEQGYPFYSGSGIYRKRFTLPEGFSGVYVFVEPRLEDDAVEVLVNGRSAGVRLWPPYRVEITNLLQPGENTLELRVANTLVNLLEATPRPSGITGPAEVVAYAGLRV